MTLLEKEKTKLYCKNVHGRFGFGKCEYTNTRQSVTH